MAKKDDQQTNVRLPAALKDRITQAAEEAGRSFTAEMVSRLEASFESVLEATLLQARLVERTHLLSAWHACLEELRVLQKRISEELSSTNGLIESGQDDPSALDRVALLRNKVEVVEGEIRRLGEYQARVDADIALLSDGLSERLDVLRKGIRERKGIHEEPGS